MARPCFLRLPRRIAFVTLAPMSPRIPVVLLSLFSSLAAVAAAAPFKVKLWPGEPPGAIASSTYREVVQLRDNDPNKPRISKVTEPTLEVFLPPKETATGAAVVICPGGGYGVLAYDHEGIQVAKFFNSIGIAGLVLKYRLPSDEIMQDKSVGPLQDVQEAIRTARRRAAEWGYSPNKIGVMGFSAGGHLAGTATTMYAEKVYTPADATSARPDFSILVYGVLSLDPSIVHGGTAKSLLGPKPDPAQVERFSSDLRVDAQTPPTFVVHSQDDKTVPVEHSLRFFRAMKKFNVPGELHIFEKGGHGYGLGVNPGSPSHWPDTLKVWLKAHGY